MLLLTATVLAGTVPSRGPPCGSCDAERLALSPRLEKPYPLWTSPADMDGWERRQLSVQSPETFETEYQRTRGWCDDNPAGRWSAAKPLVDHTVEYMRAKYGFHCASEGKYCRCIGRVYYGRLEDVSTLGQLLHHPHSYEDTDPLRPGTCCGSCGGMRDPSPSDTKQCFCSVYTPRGFAYAAAWMRPLGIRQPPGIKAKVCKAPPSTDKWGRTEETFITRVGPIAIDRAAYERGEQGDIKVSLIPALPKSGTAYLTEAVDFYYDAAVHLANLATHTRCNPYPPSPPPAPAVRHAVVPISHPYPNPATCGIHLAGTRQGVGIPAIAPAPLECIIRRVRAGSGSTRSSQTQHPRPTTTRPDLT